MNYAGQVGSKVTMTCYGSNVDISDIVWMYYPQTTSGSSITIWSNNALTTGSSNRYFVSSYYTTSNNNYSSTSGIPMNTQLTTSLTIYPADASDSGIYVCSCNTLKSTCSSTTVARMSLSVCNNYLL